jgi:hypothetical protein
VVAVLEPLGQDRWGDNSRLQARLQVLVVNVYAVVDCIATRPRQK